MKSYAQLTLGIIVVWFVFALVAGARHTFVNPSNGIGGAVGIAASVPLVAFAVWFAASKTFREFALSLNAQTLTLIQSFRVLGVVFVILEAHRLLPAVFAWPAGYGDIFIGATAGFAALKLLGNRSGFIAWQVLGILDLVNAVALGTTARLIDPHGALMVPMTVLPLSLIPTFAVPLLLIFHVICIAQARSWKSSPASNHHIPALSHI